VRDTVYFCDRRMSYSAQEPMHSKQIAVLGLGYVGCVSAASLARMGHGVIGVDKDEFKVSQVRAGNAPFYEPGLEEMVQAEVAAGRLTATSDLGEAIGEADVALICVGTPSERNGNLGLDQLNRISGEIATLLPGRTKPLIVAVRSTVFPGTCESMVIPHFQKYPNVAVVSNPEFLREGSAIQDFMEPSLVVVGGSDPCAVKEVAALYDGLGVTPCLVSLGTAEMIKYSCNAFHAVKISFANEIGSLCAEMKISAVEVMETLCRDTRLNISAAYLKPGFAFGGSCLPKDLRALVYRASRLDLKLPMLEAVLPSNQRHMERAIQRVLDLPPDAKIGVFGLAFKENTDDLRESPVVTLIEHLIGKGRDLRIFDPHIQLEEIYGSNKNFVLQAIPHIGKLMVDSLAGLLEWADAVVIAQKPRADAQSAMCGSGRRIVELVRLGE
jgi:GDP-mannose 6-dehydrogenase